MTGRRHADWGAEDAAEGGEADPAAPDPSPDPDPDPRLDPADALARLAADDRFEFRLTGGRGFILDFEQGRDVINLRGLGLTPWDLTPSVQGRDLALAFEGGEVILRGAAGVHLTQWDFRY
ncbi:MAG: hypothetical protein VYD87_15405 [Pseudomonadota bacterium]|nr:hypothetical protein [Pseudomonadota bacterium]